MVAVLLVWVTVSCVPMSVTYYEPSAPGMEAAPDRTSGLARAFNADGLVLTVAVREASVTDFAVEPPGDMGALFTIGLSVRLADGASAVFMSDELEWSTDASEETKTLSLSAMSYNDYPEGRYARVFVDHGSVMVGKRYVLGKILGRDFSQMRAYAAGAQFEKAAAPETFYVKLPGIRTESGEVEFPVVTFTKVREFGVYPVN